MDFQSMDWWVVKHVILIEKTEINVESLCLSTMKEIKIQFFRGR